MRTLPLLLAALFLTGCVRTAASIVTLPVRATSQAVDWATTSQDEADRNRGRRERRAEERVAKAARKAAREQRKAAERAAREPE